MLGENQRLIYCATNLVAATQPDSTMTMHAEKENTLFDLVDTQLLGTACQQIPDTPDMPLPFVLHELRQDQGTMYQLS